MFSLKVGSQYVCWNSFRSCWYLSKKKSSEVFYHEYFKRSSLRREEAFSVFPSAKVVNAWSKGEEKNET